MALERLAVPSVATLIFFLAYSSQWLLLSLEPGPLSRKQTIRFNILLVCLIICYSRSVWTDPGALPRTESQKIEEEEKKEKVNKNPGHVRKWCRRCKAAKPPRTHHCKECNRCIPKMDHHCPWTQNCVSHTTFPHFVRFLFYAVISMIYLTTFLWPRLSHIWQNRHLPSYLGPSMFQLGHLFFLTLANFATLFVLTILLLRNIWCLAVNTTTIEGWEIERHKQLVRRARVMGGYLDSPDGAKIKIEKQEFPFDVGIWENFKQGMGTGNIISWFWPFAATPPIGTGVSFPVNGFSDPELVWPPPDPDRIYRRVPKGMDKGEEAFTFRDEGLTAEETLSAFKKRQSEDVVRRRKPFVQRAEALLAREKRSERGDEDSDEDMSAEDEEPVVGVNDSTNGSHSGEEGWRNPEGERLRDFGVDEDVEFYDQDDEDLPLSELLARKRRVQASTAA